MAMKNRQFWGFLISGILIFLAHGVRAEPQYCVALRGNGAHMPALWGALAQLVENYGLPKALAGSSSGSITSFFYESILSNPWLSTHEDIKRQQVAFLLKSLVGFFDDHYGKYIRLSGVRKDRTSPVGWVGLIPEAWITDSDKNYFDVALYKQIDSILKRPEKLDDLLPKVKLYLSLLRLVSVFNGAQIQRLRSAVYDYDQVDSFTGLPLRDPFKRRVLMRELERTHQALRVLISMDVRNDSDFFWRDGIIRFDKFAQMMGFVGNFYAARFEDEDFQRVFQDFLNCYPGTDFLSWREIVDRKPLCQKLLKRAINLATALNLEKSKSRLHEPVGSVVPIFVATGFVPDYSNFVTEFFHSRKLWLDAFEKISFPVLPEKDFYVGYFGPLNLLRQVQEEFLKKYPSDSLANNEKSRRFYILGPEPWSMVFQYSPAEPGLSPLVSYSGRWARGLSLGGWADLAPVMVLKASGCSQVVYVTRYGGEPLNLQRLVAKLLGKSGFPWEEIEHVANDTLGGRFWLQGGVGPVIKQVDPFWDRWFNLNRPDSVISLTLKSADAVVCTRWDQWDPLKGYYQVFEEGYRGLFYLSPRWQLKPKGRIHVVLPQDNRWIKGPYPESYWPTLGGCIPHERLTPPVKGGNLLGKAGDP